MLRNYYYNDHMYAEELQEILSQLKDNTNHHGIHLLKNAVLTDMNANKIIKRLEHMKKNIHNKNSISIIDPDSRHMEDKKRNNGIKLQLPSRNRPQIWFYCGQLHHTKPE